MFIKIEKFENGVVKNIEIKADENFVREFIHDIISIGETASGNISKTESVLKDNEDNDTLDIFSNKDKEFAHKKRFPNIINKLRCPSCNQASLFFIGDNDDEMIRVLSNGADFSIIDEEVELVLPLEDKSETYEFIHELIDLASTQIVLTNNPDKCTCPMCSHEGTIASFSNHANAITDKCNYCGGEIEEIVDEKLNFSTKCTECDFKK